SRESRGDARPGACPKATPSTSSRTRCGPTSRDGAWRRSDCAIAARWIGSRAPQSKRSPRARQALPDCDRPRVVLHVHLGIAGKWFRNRPSEVNPRAWRGAHGGARSRGVGARRVLARPPGATREQRPAPRVLHARRQADQDSLRTRAAPPPRTPRWDREAFPRARAAALVRLGARAGGRAHAHHPGGARALVACHYPLPRAHRTRAGDHDAAGTELVAAAFHSLVPK